MRSASGHEFFIPELSSRTVQYLVSLASYRTSRIHHTVLSNLSTDCEINELVTTSVAVSTQGIH